MITTESIRNKKWFSVLCLAGYALLFFMVTVYSTLYYGWTHWSSSAYKVISDNDYFILLSVVFGICVVAEGIISWKRAFFAVAVYLIYRLADTTFANRILAELFILVLLSNLANRKKILIIWASIHIAYIGILIYLQTNGLTSEITTDDILKQIYLNHYGSSFGMGHPNSFALLIMSMMMTGWLYKRPKKRWITWLFFFIGALVVFYLTLCRTVCILLILFPLISWITEIFFAKRRGWKRSIFTLLPVILLGVTLAISLFVLNNNDGVIPGNFWWRFKDFRFIREVAHTLFGTTDKSGYSNVVLDNLYYWLIAYCGIIPTVITITCSCYMNLKLYDSNDLSIMAVVILISVYSIMENAAVYPFHYVVPLLAFCDQRERIRRFDNDKANRLEETDQAPA